MCVEQGPLANTWVDYYRYGAANEIYVETFSADLIGFTFAQAAQYVFFMLNITSIK